MTIAGFARQASHLAKLDFGELLARVSERNSKARETGDITIARRWSAPGVSMVRVTPRKEKIRNRNPWNG